MMERNSIQLLFKQHYAKMLRVARTILYDEQESKDVVSDIFEGLLRGRTVLMPDTEERYLLTSVRNQCLKRIRHQETRLRMESATAGQTSIAEHEDERMTDIVEFVVSHLTEQEQHIFRLRFSEGYSYEEIASAEGISRVAVWKHLSHALQEIKNRFNPKGL
jgi:RNA polymerase sigma-70 factor (ECF subfamily)